MRHTLFAFLFVIATRCFAADYYVSPTGNDGAAGSAAQPWRTITRALTGRGAGDVVHLQAGAVFTENVSVASAGAAGSPIVLTSDPADRATIRQASATKDGISIYNKGYLTLENLIVTGVGRALTTKAGINAYADNGMYRGLTFRNVTATEFYRGFVVMGYGAAAYGFSDVLFERCAGNYNLDAGAITWAQAAGGIRNLTVRDSEFNYNFGDPASSKNSGNGFSAGSIWDGLFEYVVTHDNGGDGNATEGPVGIMVYDSKRVTIQYCESYGNLAKYQDGDGFDLDLGTSDSTIQYCYSHDNYGAGYLLSTDGALTTWSGNVIRYNVSENDGYGGKLGALHLYSPGSLAPLQNSEIYGNTIFTSVGPAVWLYDFANMAGIKIRNNVFVVANGMPLVKHQVSPTPTTAQAQFQGNLYWTNGGAFAVAGYTSLAAWRSAKGQEMLNASPVGLAADPLLNAPGAGGTIGDPHALDGLTAYELQPGSPAIDAGLDLPLLFGLDMGPADFFSHAIPQGAGYDIGAAEFVSGPAPTPPAAPSGLATTVVASSWISLAWTDNASDESGFQIERSTDGSSFALLATVGANVTTYTDGGLPSGATRYYRVRAYNGAGTSAYTSVVSATTLAPSRPAAPSGLTAAATQQKGRIALAWQASSGATSYTVKRATISGGPYATVASGVTTTTYTNAGLKSRTTYYYVVTAVNAAGESPNSNQASATAK